MLAKPHIRRTDRHMDEGANKKSKDLVSEIQRVHKFLLAPLYSFFNFSARGGFDFSGVGP